MAYPNGYFVDRFGFPIRSGIIINSDGTFSIITYDSNGNPVITPITGGGGGGNGVWGQITGTLSNQTDLQAALTTLTNAAAAAATTANWGSISGSITSQADLQAALAAAAAGGAPTAWQTITAPVSNANPVAINRASGINALISGVVDNTQVIQVPSNMADGQEMQLNLVGGGGSGSWTTWSSGTPSTPGYVFLQGSAPTAPSLSTSYVPVYVKRRGVKYECSIGIVGVV